MKSIKQILMSRDGLSASEADSLISEVKEQFREYIRAGEFHLAEDIFLNELGLEPDYLFEFL